MSAQRSKTGIGVTTLEDISALILQSHDLNETLRNIVNLIAKRMRSDVCSIYLLDADNTTLRLQASKGLSKRAVGKVTMQVCPGAVVVDAIATSFHQGGAALRVVVVAVPRVECDAIAVHVEHRASGCELVVAVLVDEIATNFYGIWMAVFIRIVAVALKL